MQKHNNVMLDLETAGKTKNAALVSIGAVFFHPASGEIGKGFYIPVKLASSMYYGLEVDGGTIEWWMRQNDEARAVFNDENRAPLKEALNQLNNFIRENSQDEDVQVWGNGPAFDNAIIATAFDKTFIKPAWKYSKERCVRTMVELGRQIGIDPKYDAARQVDIDWEEAATEQCLSDQEITNIVNAATGVIVSLSFAI
ncbi:MAG: 3'-5' exonuclease [Rikenellaceae bacterium]